MAPADQHVHLHHHILFGIRADSVDVDERNISVENPRIRQLAGLFSELVVRVRCDENVPAAANDHRRRLHLLVFHRVLRTRHIIRIVLGSGNEGQVAGRGAGDPGRGGTVQAQNAGQFVFRVRGTLRRAQSQNIRSPFFIYFQIFRISPSSLQSAGRRSRVIFNNFYVIKSARMPYLKVLRVIPFAFSVGADKAAGKRGAFFPLFMFSDWSDF